MEESPSKILSFSPELIHRSVSGFCELYRVNRQGRFRVLKCLKEEFKGKEPYEGFLRKEFEIGYSLDHPNICAYYGFHKEEGMGNCIEMEWVDGLTLEAFLEQGKPDKNLEEKLLEELCDALSYLHSKQVIHRDLKPSNILITHKGNTVKLIDFGFSDSDSHSILKASAGTLVYTAPEVLAGQEADVRSDIYSLGLILYRFSRRYRQVARKCCETKPWRRYGSIQEVRKALSSLWSLVPGMLFLLLVVAIVLYPYVSRRLSQEDAPVTEMDTLVPSPADSLPLLKEETSPVPARKAPSAPKEDSSVGEDVIDELFRQATELFD